MMKFKAWTKFSALTLLCVSSLSVAAQQQTVMSLEQCLAYAKENNITLKQAKLEVEEYGVNQAMAKGNFLPAVSASVGQSLGNSPFTSDDDKTTYSGSYGLDLSMSLYKGGANRMTLEQSKLDVKSANLNLLEAQNSLEVSITQSYIEILYSIEQIEVAQKSLELSQKNVERAEKQLKLGSINQADLAQLKSAEATERYNLVVAQTSLSSKYLTLKQLLEIDANTTFAVAKDDYTQKAIDANIPSIDQVFKVAMEIRPEIQSSQNSVLSAEIDQKIAKAAFLPTVSLSAGLGLSHKSPSDYTFSNQLKNNYDHSIGVNVSIPIFNRFDTKNNVKKSAIAVKYASLDLEQSTKTLYQTIESLHVNAVNAKAMYEVSELQLEALKISLDLVSKQFELGSKDIIELLTEQNDYRESAQEYLQSKYTFILNKAILNFYQSGIIKL